MSLRNYKSVHHTPRSSPLLLRQTCLLHVGISGQHIRVWSINDLGTVRETTSTPRSVGLPDSMHFRILRRRQFVLQPSYGPRPHPTGFTPEKDGQIPSCFRSVLGPGLSSPGFTHQKRFHHNYPARACASKGLCDRSWCPYSSIYLQGLFSIFQNTHFQTPISAQEGFSSNLIAFSIP